MQSHCLLMNYMSNKVKNVKNILGPAAKMWIFSHCFCFSRIIKTNVWGKHSWLKQLIKEIIVRLVDKETNCYLQTWLWITNLDNFFFLILIWFYRLILTSYSLFLCRCHDKVYVYSVRAGSNTTAICDV